MVCGAGLAAALAPACTAKPVRLAAGFALGWGTAFALAGKAMQGHAQSRWATQTSTIHVN